MPKATCQNCDRTVLVVNVGGEQVMTDPELIMVVAARERRVGPSDDGTGGMAMATRTTWARRIHGDLCETYKSAAAREKIQREQRDYNRRNGRPKAPRRNHGL
jgi:hypothetical protein